MGEVTDSDLEALDKEVAELEAAVNERQELVEKIVNFVEAITREQGQVITRDEHSSHTHVACQLKHFGGFSFLSSSGHNIMGGNDIEVWHHLTSPNMVFRVYYQVSLRECQVTHSQHEERWLPALLELMEHKDEVIAQAEQKEVEAAERRRQMVVLAYKKAALQNRAGELKL